MTSMKHSEPLRRLQRVLCHRHLPIPGLCLPACLCKSGGHDCLENFDPSFSVMDTAVRGSGLPLSDSPAGNRQERLSHFRNHWLPWE